MAQGEKGLFQKGNTYSKGRPRGSQNAVTKASRERIAAVCDEYYNSEQFKKDLDSLEARDRLTLMERFTNYIAPKMQSTTVEANVTQKQSIAARLIELSKMNERPPATLSISPAVND